MRTRLRFVAAGVLLVVCLAGCDLSPGDVSTPSVDQATREQMASDCLDIWLNTDAAHDLIVSGMGMKDDNGIAVVVQDSNGKYHANAGTNAFIGWIALKGNPWTDIKISILSGVGCPYDPIVKAELDQETQDCLQVWVNTEASQAAVDAGLVTTGPDGVPVSPVLTLGSDGQYRVDILSDNFQVWIADTDDSGTHDYFVPWDHIYFQAIADEGCPYGPSPEQSPTATAS